MAKEESNARKVLTIVADFVSTFLTTIIVIVAVAIVAIRLMGWSMYSVDSYSMTPAYPIDSLIIVQSVEPETIQVGDVITYVLNEDGVLVTHRVTAIDRANETFTTKGDANESADSSPVLWANVVGKVVFGIPKVGALLRIVTADENRPIVIGIIVALLVISFGCDIVSRQIKKRRLKKPVAVEEALTSEEISEDADIADNDSANANTEVVSEDEIASEEELISEEPPDSEEEPVPEEEPEHELDVDEIIAQVNRATGKTNQSVASDEDTQEIG